MKTRTLGLALVVTLAGLAPAPAVAQPAAKAPPAAGAEARLPGYLNNFLSYDPASKVTVEKGSSRTSRPRV